MKIFKISYNPIKYKNIQKRSINNAPRFEHKFDTFCSGGKNKIPPEIIKGVVEDYKNNVPMVEIRKKYGYNSLIINQIIKNNEESEAEAELSTKEDCMPVAKIKTADEMAKEITQKRNKEIIQMRRNHFSIPDIALFYQTDPNDVVQIINDNVSQNDSDEDTLSFVTLRMLFKEMAESKILELYVSGTPIKEISHNLGISRPEIERFLSQQEDIEQLRLIHKYKKTKID